MNTKFLVAMIFLPSMAVAQTGSSGDASSSISITAPGPSSTFLGLEAEAKASLGVSRATQGDDLDTSSRWIYFNPIVTHRASGVSLGSHLSYGQSFSSERGEVYEGTFENPIFSLSKDFSSEGLFKSMKAGLAGSAPGNRTSVDRTYRGSVGPYVELSEEMGRFSLTQTLAYSRGFYDVEFTEAGDFNAADAFKGALAVDYSFTEKLTLSGLAQYLHATGSTGESLNRPAWTVSLEYEFDKRISAGAGFGSAVGFVSPDAQYEQLTLPDSTARQAYIELAVSI